MNTPNKKLRRGIAQSTIFESPGGWYAPRRNARENRAIPQPGVGGFRKGMGGRDCGLRAGGGQESRIKDGRSVGKNIGILLTGDGRGRREKKSIS